MSSTPTNNIAFRVTFFLGAVSALLPDARVRIGVDTAIRAKDVDIEYLTWIRDTTVIVVDYLSVSEGATPNWDALTTRLVTAGCQSAGQLMDQGIALDDSSGWWSFRFK